MITKITDIWVYLEQTPLLWLAMTLVAFQFATYVYQWSRSLPLCNPVLIAVTILVVILLATDTPYDVYFSGAQFVHFALGPATVALAIPLYLYYDKLKTMAVPLLGALVVGSLFAVLAVVVLGRALGIEEVTMHSLMPKSITTPIAMGISEQIGGLPSLTAVFVILTGIVGATLAPHVLDLLGINDHLVRGFAMGLASHGIGTARAFQLHQEAGAFSGLAMGLNGAVTAIIIPIVVHWIG